LSRSLQQLLVEKKRALAVIEALTPEGEQAPSTIPGYFTGLTGEWPHAKRSMFSIWKRYK
jgi:hypothetical protein